MLTVNPTAVTLANSGDTVLVVVTDDSPSGEATGNIVFSLSDGTTVALQLTVGQTMPTEFGIPQNPNALPVEVVFVGQTDREATYRITAI